jgi:hypothetical protein
MTGVKPIAKKALHHLAGHQLVKIQEAVNMVDDQELVICSDSMMYVNVSLGQVLRNDVETDKQKDIITVYRNHKKIPRPISGTILLPCVTLKNFHEIQE